MQLAVLTNMKTVPIMASSLLVHQLSEKYTDTYDKHKSLSRSPAEPIRSL